MASLLTVQKIIDEFGKYYVNEGQNKQRLTRSLVQPAVTLEKHARKIPTTETIYKAANYEFQSVIQPFKKTFDPKSNIEFFPNTIQLRQIKVDADVYPNDIEESWLGFLANNDCSVKDWPIVRFIMEEYLKKQIDADREEKMVYKGVYNAQGTDPGDAMDGIKQILLNSLNTDYPVNVISGIGVLNANSIFDQIEAFDEALPELYNEQKVIIFMAPKWVRLYKKDKRSQGFFFIDDIKKVDESIDFSKHYICPLPSMSGTDDMFATVAGNLAWITKREGNLSNIQVQAHDRCVHILLDWWEGLGFLCNKMVWTTTETVGSPSPIDIAIPSDGIIPRNIIPVTLAAIDIAATTATLRGRVLGDPLDANATVEIEYGPTNNLGTPENATLANGIYSAAITGLTTATTYYYQIQVTIGSDKFLGEIETFETE